MGEAEKGRNRKRNGDGDGRVQRDRAGSRLYEHGLKGMLGIVIVIDHLNWEVAPLSFLFARSLHVKCHAAAAAGASDIPVAVEGVPFHNIHFYLSEADQGEKRECPPKLIG
ncbi:hypothetical protein H6P81_015765 [Aristolochia fimbriata]|uniref:Uncharacterized protein n=1 Tax=Aristolochia fimbriata TaxID=158543 RepID=A0AAV7E6F4_ARIFI|nr:hypothetical protein H6P81_015765 [Aristolochia fimbriata]